MAGFGINISDVNALVAANGMSSEDGYFAISYRKADGSFGRKNRVRRRAGKGHLNVERKDIRSIERIETDASKYHLITESGVEFEVFICLVTHYNGKLIDHRF